MNSAPAGPPVTGGPPTLDPLATGPVATDPLATGAATDSPATRPAAAGDRPSSYAATKSPRELWRRLRLPIALALLVIVTAIALASYRQRVRHGEFDPASPDPRGSRAVAALLAENGIEITRVVGLPAGHPAGLVFVPFAGELSRERLASLANPGPGEDVVLVAPDQTLDVLGIEVKPGSGRDGGVRVPGCDFPAAVTAGAADVSGVSYDVGAVGDATVQTCYASSGRPSLVYVERDDASVTIIGSGDALTNVRLGAEGNAALALALLGRDEPITWVMRGTVATVRRGDTKSLWDLLPDGVYFGALQVFFAVIVAMLWRGRRLGPVVTEPLPVIVRAAEAVEGRGRLYAAAKARDRAGWILRRSARNRLRTRLGLPPDAGNDVLVAGAAERTTRRPDDIGRLLYGPDPVDDAALVRLAADLDTLDSEVRRS